MAGQQPQNPQDGDPPLRGWRDFFNQPRGEQQGGWRDVFNQPRGEQQGGWMDRAKEIFNQPRGETQGGWQDVFNQPRGETQQPWFDPSTLPQSELEQMTGEGSIFGPGGIPAGSPLGDKPLPKTEGPDHTLPRPRADQFDPQGRPTSRNILQWMRDQLIKQQNTGYRPSQADPYASDSYPQLRVR